MVLRSVPMCSATVALTLTVTVALALALALALTLALPLTRCRVSERLGRFDHHGAERVSGQRDVKGLAVE